VVFSGFAAGDVRALRTMLLELFENAGALDNFGLQQCCVDGEQI
jgi:hypothetical protein